MLHTQPEKSVAVDPIAVINPSITPAARSLHSRLLSARNVSTAARQATPAGGTRDLYLMIGEVADAWLFRDASMVELADAVELCQALWRAAQIAERLEGLA